MVQFIKTKLKREKKLERVLNPDVKNEQNGLLKYIKEEYIENMNTVVEDEEIWEPLWNMF